MTRLWGLAAAIVAMGIAACGGDGVGVHPPGEEETCTADCLGDAICQGRGDFSYCSCASGFEYDAAAGCVNIDECQAALSPCADAFDCQDTEVVD